MAKRSHAARRLKRRGYSIVCMWRSARWSDCVMRKSQFDLLLAGTVLALAVAAPAFAAAAQRPGRIGGAAAAFAQRPAAMRHDARQRAGRPARRTPARPTPRRKLPDDRQRLRHQGTSTRFSRRATRRSARSCTRIVDLKADRAPLRSRAGDRKAVEKFLRHAQLRAAVDRGRRVSPARAKAIDRPA